MSNEKTKQGEVPTQRMICITEAEYSDVEEVIYAARHFLMLNEKNSDATDLPHFEELRRAVALHRQNRTANRKPRSGLIAALAKLSTKH